MGACENVRCGKLYGQMLISHRLGIRVGEFRGFIDVTGVVHGNNPVVRHMGVALWGAGTRGGSQMGAVICPVPAWLFWGVAGWGLTRLTVVICRL